MKIILIGGTSPFGKFWEKYFKSKGFDVIISSRSTKIKPEKAILKGDIIIFCVSIRNTAKVIEKLVPIIPEGKLVMDFTGIKKLAYDKLKDYKSGELVLTHPLFGPWIKNLKDQNIIFDPVNAGKKWNIIFGMLEKDGANLIKMTSKEHDEIVSIVQSSVHFMNLLFGLIIKKRGFNIKNVFEISTPNSRMQMLILARFLNQNPSLYTDMQFYNEIYKEEILEDINFFVNKLSGMIKNGEIEEFEKTFFDTKEFIGGDFLEKSLETTKKIEKDIKKL